MNRVISFIIILFCYTSIMAQDGYWQQEVNYSIDVTLNDKKHEIHAFETIEYINNSPDDLSYIYMHLWPNAYKNDETALAKQLYENGELKFYYSKESEKGYIDSLDFMVNNETVKWELDSTYIDIAKITLNRPLPSGGKITITTPFHVKIPKGVFSRLGHIGESYQITQWYPKPAVYDQNGWNQMPYLTQGEFYSEYGSFDVSITLPKNYVVGATGDMIDGENELAWLDEKVALTKEKLHFDLSDMSFPESSTEKKTLRFRQSNVHDFAWFADKRYHVLKGEIELPHSKEKVTTWAMFTNSEADLWINSIEYLNDAIYYYSLWNGDYPYKHCTAVDGALSAGGGMEYPNVTVIGKSNTAFYLETVIMHEVGHNWFYGILGSNERVHPWMDEGLNSFNESRYIQTKHPNSSIAGPSTTNKMLNLFDLDQYHYRDQSYLAYQFSTRKNLDQPIEEHSAIYTPGNYGSIVYGKSALSFHYLMAYLGEDVMDQCMKKYFETWKFKHPQPKDFKKIIQEESGKPLDWFFNDMLTTTKRLDYKIVSQKKTTSQFNVQIKNVGEINGPFSLSAIKNDSIVTTKWYDGFQGSQTVELPIGEYDYFKIDATSMIPEVRRKNNTIKTKGLLKKTEPLSLQLIGSVENPEKTQLFWSPTIGWNNYDKTMLGVAFYNSVIPQKRLEYVISPMYSFVTNQPVGSAMLNYNMVPRKSNLLTQITVGVSGQSYHTFNQSNLLTSFEKVSPYVDFHFKKREARNTHSTKLRLREITINEKYSSSCDDGSCVQGKGNTVRNYYQILYQHYNQTTLNPYNAVVKLEGAKDFAKLSWEGNFQLDYKKKNKSFNIRLFAGSFLFNDTNHPRFNWRMDGTSGYYDYLYDHVFLGRNESGNLLGQQFVATQGGFKIPTPVGQSHKWITAVNVKADIPIPIPVGLYADFGYNEAQSFNYNFGIHIPLAKDVFEIYFPISYSEDVKTAIDANALTYSDLIRFTLHLEKVNPFKLIQDIDL